MFLRQPLMIVGGKLRILLFHGSVDDVVPISTNEDLARELPRHVEFHRVPRVAHVGSWNVDPRAYERRVRLFLERLAG